MTKSLCTRASCNDSFGVAAGSSGGLLKATGALLSGMSLGLPVALAALVFVPVQRDPMDEGRDSEIGTLPNRTPHDQEL